jgi:hypothetical protein
LWQTVALGFAFGGQSQLLSNPMLGNGPYGGLPKPVQITKAQTTPMMIQKAVRLFVTSCSRLHSHPSYTTLAFYMPAAHQFKVTD